MSAPQAAQGKKTPNGGSPRDEGAKNNGKAGRSKGPPEERYVVVIRNVENDLAAIHREALPQMLNLDPTYRLGETASREKDEASRPQYNVTVRTETKSAEVKLYNLRGAARSSLEAMFNKNRGAPAASASKQDGSLAPGLRKRGRDEASAGANGEDSHPTPPPRDPRPLVTDASGVVSKYHDRPYYGSKLQLRAVTKEQLQQQASRIEDLEAPTTATEDGAAPAVGGRMRELVSAEVGVSVPFGTNQLSRILRDVPGFDSCWKLGAQRFRAVFTAKSQLFAAKSLLDEFEADGVRLTLALPESWTDAYNDYVMKRTESLV